MRQLVWLALGFSILACGIAAAQDQAPSQRYDTCRTRMAFEERTRGLCLAADEVAQQTIIWDAAHHPSDHARAQLALGNALYTIGSIASEAAAYQGAVEAYRAAANYYDDPDTRVRWAGTLLGMGGALNSLARLGDTRANEEALRTLSSAIAVTRRAHQPDIWAALHTTLGEAYFTRWRQVGDSAALEQAYVAYEAALEVYRRPRYEERGHRVEQRLEEMRREAVAASAPAQ